MRWCHERGMTDYVYAPKDDPKHRERWREPYDDDEVAGFRRLAEEGGLRLGFALSPGLSIDPNDPGDRQALVDKVTQVLQAGAGLVVLALDDLPPRPGLGEEHAALTGWLAEALDGRAPLVLVPTEYTGTGAATPYLDALAAGVPDDVPIGWTGRLVVNDSITVAEAEARTHALGGRPPLIWDNYPVNDAFMTDRLFLGPLRGREPGLGDVCGGYLANPMVQARASLVPLASAAGYLRGEYPEAAWAADVGDLRVLAEACDGVLPARLVDDVVAGGPVDDLRAWLGAAASCEAPGLGDEVIPWVDATRREAGLGLTAVRVLDALADGPDLAAATEQALALAFLWPGVARSSVTVMGPRLAFRPMLGQRADGTWTLDPAARQEGQNAIDALVRHALDRLAAAEATSRK